MIPSPPTLAPPVLRQIGNALSCALGPVESAPLSGEELGEHGLRFLARAHLDSRVVARFGDAWLRRALGEPSTESLVAAHGAARAVQLHFSSVALQVTEVAARCRIPLMLMKGMALLAGGHVAPGQRYFQDVDVLVPRAHAAELWQELVERGYRPCGVAHSAEHTHLEALIPKLGGAVEIHRWLPGIGAREGADRSELDELLRAGACRPAPGYSAGTWLPRPGLLAASLLAHGFGSHFQGGFAGYFGLRLLADLCDLSPALRPTDDEVIGLLAATIDPALVAAAEEIVEHIRSGHDPTELLGGGADLAGRLLTHLVALEVDRDYRHFVHYRRVSNGFAATGWWHRIFYSRRELEAAFGSHAAVRRWYLRRPFQLVAIAGSAASSWWKMRRRGAAEESGAPEC